MSKVLVYSLIRKKLIEKFGYSQVSKVEASNALNYFRVAKEYHPKIFKEMESLGMLESCSLKKFVLKRK